MQTYTKPKDVIEAPAFNMAMLYYITLNRIMEVKARAMLTQNISDYYSSLKLIYVHISFMLKDEEKGLLETMFDRVINNLKVNNKVAFSLVKRNLENIDIQLFAYLKKYNMIFPKIEAHLGVMGQYLKYDLVK